MFDKLHICNVHNFIHSFIHSFIHLPEILLFTYSLNLFIYLSDQTFIHLTFEYNIFRVS